MKTSIRELLSGVSAMTPITIDTNTDPRLRGGKKNPHKGPVRKVNNNIEIIVFQNKKSNGYSNLIKLGLVEEGKDPKDFKLSERTWGTRISGTPFIEHKGEYYLEVITQSRGNIHYELDGQLIDKQDVQGIPPTPVGGRQGDLEKKVIINTYKISSLTSITIDGTTHTNLYYPS